MSARRRPWLGCALALTAWPLAGPPALAAWRPDAPARVQTVKGADGDEVTCTSYRDVFLRQPQTDTPSPGRTLLLHTAGPASCPRRSPAGRSLETSEFAFAGRKGAFLLFEEADPNGASSFMVFDARSGRRLLRDSILGGASPTDDMEVEVSARGALRLAYRRGLNTPCSIPARPSACWRAVTRDRRNGVPREIARLPPPVEACRAAYGEVDRSDPSVISYEVRRVLTRDGRRRTLATGPLGCQALP